MERAAAAGRPRRRRPAADRPPTTTGWSRPTSPPTTRRSRRCVELGLGRVRVMSPLGRDDAADRWYAGDGGPRTAMAAHAPGRCGDLRLLPAASRARCGRCSASAATVLARGTARSSRSTPAAARTPRPCVAVDPPPAALPVLRRRALDIEPRCRTDEPDRLVTPVTPRRPVRDRRRTGPGAGRLDRVAGPVPRGRQRRGGLRPRRLPGPADRRAGPERRRRRRPGRRARGAAAVAGRRRRCGPPTPARRWTPTGVRRWRRCGRRPSGTAAASAGSGSGSRPCCP